MKSEQPGEEYLQRARELADSGDFERSCAEYAKVLPALRKAQMGAALVEGEWEYIMTLLQLEDVSEARVVLEQFEDDLVAFRIRPSSVQRGLLPATFAFVDGDYDGALTVLEGLVDENDGVFRLNDAVTVMTVTAMVQHYAENRLAASNSLLQIAHQYVSATTHASSTDERDCMRARAAEAYWRYASYLSDEFDDVRFDIEYILEDADDDHEYAVRRAAVDKSLGCTVVGDDYTAAIYGVMLAALDNSDAWNRDLDEVTLPNDVALASNVGCLRMHVYLTLGARRLASSEARRVLALGNPELEDTTAAYIAELADDVSGPDFGPDALGR
jgi:hypothetical protein